MCASFAIAGETLIEVFPDANDGISARTAWYYRSEYHPYGKKIDGIAVQSISKNWCAANFLEIKQFPSDIQQELKTYTSAFNVSNLSVGKDRNVKASVGIARICDEDKNKFFLLMTASAKNKQTKILFMEEFADADIVSLSKIDEQTLEVWWCLECDSSSKLTWRNGKFEWLPQEEMGND